MKENYAAGNVSCLYLALPVRSIDKNNVFWQLVIGNQDVIQLVIHCFSGDLEIETERTVGDVSSDHLPPLQLLQRVRGSSAWLLASAQSPHRQKAAGTDTCQQLQSRSILQGPLLATLVLLPITPPATHFYLPGFILTVAQGILGSWKPGTTSLKEGIESRS